MNFMSFSPGNILGLCLIAMATIWLVLVRNLFRSLSARHPQKYEEMGKPSITQNNNFRTNVRFFRFLFSTECSSLNDLSISKRVNFLRIWLIICFFAFMVSLSVGTQ